MIHVRSLRFTVAAGLLFPLVALASGIFPDVDDNHPFKGEIESLARGGVIHGNPNGYYYPEKSVNRAEFLKLLYAATGRKPQALSGCFSDVEVGSWYEAYVCDASTKANGFVQGYSDGKFRPGSAVSRTEAMKMTFTVFGLAAPEVTASDQDLIKFVDISVSAWYSRYIVAAYKNGMFPIAGQSGTRFYPDRELTRGEAAAYIFNAQQVLERKFTSSAPSSSSSSSSSSASSEVANMDIIKQVAFPFSDKDKFTKKKPISYEFTLTAPKTTVHIQTNAVGFYQSDLSCRLYLLTEGGFTFEYYLGVQTPNSCVINVDVGPGKYHLQLQPVLADVAYTVDATVGKSDGNDGFINTLPLALNTPQIKTLEPNDLFDWYKFKPTSTVTTTIDVTSNSTVDCIIYTPPTVDQFGFSGPECGKPYQFVAGEEYVVGVGRGKNDLEKTVTYTVKWH